METVPASETADSHCQRGGVGAANRQLQEFTGTSEDVQTKPLQYNSPQAISLALKTFHSR